jgi:3D (Asp-Asp-Asp) domain-containing protein
MPNKGIFRVEDSGSAVNGNDIDIFISDIQKALKFKKNLEVYVIRKP